MKGKVISVVGARPNFVKLAAVVPHFAKYLNHIIVHTGQHYDYELSRVFFENLDIPEPDYFLGIGSGTHGYQVGEGIKRVEELLLKVKPDLVVVYGDTNSTLAGALAAAKAGFKVAHVEAGLRSYEMKMPEEINRRLTDHISWLLFAPTENAVKNLMSEKVPGETYLTGDTHVDVLLRWIKIAEGKSDILDKLNLSPKEYVTITVHRAENTDNKARLTKIAKLIMKVSDVAKTVFPMHPRTRKALTRFRLINKLKKCGNLIIIEPLGYLDFIKLLKYSKIAITDSGGVQREAYLLKVPCLVLRNRTEWVELVNEGWVRLIDVNIEEAIKLIENPSIPTDEGSRALGDGRAGERITRIIYEKLMS